MGMPEQTLYDLTIGNIQVKHISQIFDAASTVKDAFISTRPVEISIVQDAQNSHLFVLTIYHLNPIHCMEICLAMLKAKIIPVWIKIKG